MEYVALLGCELLPSNKSLKYFLTFGSWKSSSENICFAATISVNSLKGQTVERNLRPTRLFGDACGHFFRRHTRIFGPISLGLFFDVHSEVACRDTKRLTSEYFLPPLTLTRR